MQNQINDQPLLTMPTNTQRIIMSGAMGNTTSNIANDDDLKREKYNEKQRDAYKKLSSGKKTIHPEGACSEVQTLER